MFKTLPILFAQLPGALLISSTFFILFVFTALTSSIALVEVIVANFIDLLGWSRRRSVIVVGIACFLFGIPSALSNTDYLFGNWKAIYGKSFFSTIDELVSVWFLPICGLFTAIFVGWFLDKEKVLIEFQSGTIFGKLFRPWLFFVRWIAPIAIILIILQSTGIVNLDQMFQ